MRANENIAIIKGFAAKVPEPMFTQIQALSTEYPPEVECDSIVTTQDAKDAGM